MGWAPASPLRCEPYKDTRQQPAEQGVMAGLPGSTAREGGSVWGNTGYRR